MYSKRDMIWNYKTLLKVSVQMGDRSIMLTRTKGTELILKWAFSIVKKKTEVSFTALLYYSKEQLWKFLPNTTFKQTKGDRNPDIWSFPCPFHENSVCTKQNHYHAENFFSFFKKHNSIRGKSSKKYGHYTYFPSHLKC